MSEVSADAWDFDGWQGLINDVGRWAELNFGFTEVPTTQVLYDTGEDIVRVDVLDLNAMVPSRAEGIYTGPTAALGALAPVLGLVEEIGELSRANSEGDVLDAIGDIAIYLADSMYRLKITPAELFSILGIAEGHKWPGWATVNARLTQSVGRVCHVVLKRAQRIRGMHIGTDFRFALVDSLGLLASALEHAADVHTRDDDNKYPIPAWKVGRSVFDEIVAKRNWRK